MVSLDFLLNKKLTSVFITRYQIDLGFLDDLHISIESKLIIKNNITQEEWLWENDKNNFEFKPLIILDNRIISFSYEKNELLKIRLEKEVELLIYLSIKGQESVNINYQKKFINL